jgi:hypothetical protein
MFDCADQGPSIPEVALQSKRLGVLRSILCRDPHRFRRTPHPSSSSELKVSELEERLQAVKELEKKFKKENKTGKVEAEARVEVPRATSLLSSLSWAWTDIVSTRWSILLMEFSSSWSDSYNITS